MLLHHKAFKYRTSASISTRDRSGQTNDITETNNFQFLTETGSGVPSTVSNQINPSFVTSNEAEANSTTETNELTEELTSQTAPRHNSKSMNLDDYLLQTTQGY